MLTSIYSRKGRKGVTLEYDDPRTGRRAQKQFHAKDGRSAKERALDAAAAIRVRGPEPKPAEVDVTFADYAARWLRATRTSVRIGTYRNYEKDVRVHLAIEFPGQLREVDRTKVRDLVVRLRERGMKKKSVSNIRGTLHAIFEAAIEEGLVTTNPAHFRGKSNLMRGARAADLRGTVKALDVDQARAFLEAAPAAAPRHALLFRTMMATGLRPGEAIALQPDDLDYGRGLIRVARAITRGRIEACKTTPQGAFEHVDMPTGLAAELRAWEAATAAEALSSGVPRPAWLFPSSIGGRHLDEKGVTYAMKRVLKRAHLPSHFSPHCLRHTFATQQLAAGESIYYVQRQLRHADIRMTVSRYGSWLPAGNRAAADRHFERITGMAPKGLKSQSPLR